MNFNNTNAMGRLAVTGGTVNLASGASIGTANFANAGTAAINTTPAGTLVIGSQLAIPCATAAISGGSFSFASNSGNLNNSTPAGTLAGTLNLSGGVLTLTPSFGLTKVVNVFLGAMTLTVGGNAPAAPPYIGPGPDTSDAGTVWNNPTSPFNVAATNVYTNLVNSGGGVTSVSFSAAAQTQIIMTRAIRLTDTPLTYSPLLSSYLAQNAAGTMTFAYGGLVPGAKFDLYAIANANTARSTQFVVSGSSQTIAMNGNWATNSITSTATSQFVSTEFTNVTANASGQILITANGLNGNETTVNGFQLIPLSPANSLSLPQTNIAATTSTTLDFGLYSSAVTFGGG